MLPPEVTVTVAVLPEMVLSMQTRPDTLLAQLAWNVLDPLELHVWPSTVAGMTDALAVAHSLAKPIFSAIFAPASAREREFKNPGIAIAERMPITATTIISSTNENALAAAMRGS